MVRLPVILLLSLVGCAADGDLIVIGHRAQGVGETGENLAANVPLLFDAGFGAEVDVRGDGSRPFTLGHFGPGDDTLDDVLDRVEETWQPHYAGRYLVLDIANDRSDAVSNNLIAYLDGRITGTPLEEVVFVVQSSNLQSLARLQGAYVQRASSLGVLFALTYWISTEYSTASWVDLVTGNVAAFGEMMHPKPVLLFGVETRASYRRAAESRNNVIGVITNHPRRIAALDASD
jgi:hypothetical protein